jgi:signal transduction histidine kinase
LHDGCIQSIYAIGLNLEGSRGLIVEQPVAAAGRIARAVADLNLVIHDLRALISRDHSLEGGEPGRTLREEIARAIPPGAATRFEVDIDDAVERRLTPPQSAQLAHIARESISNILRHAHARVAQVRLRRRNGVIVFEIRDDGRGFDVAAVAASAQGLGMHHIDARARKLEGRCAVSSSPGCGARIEIEIPLKA